MAPNSDYDLIATGCGAKTGGNLRIFPHKIAYGVCVQQINHRGPPSKSTPLTGGNFEFAIARSNSATSSLDTCGSESPAAKTADGVPGSPPLSRMELPTRISTDSPFGRSAGSPGTRTRPSKWTRNFVVIGSFYRETLWLAGWRKEVGGIRSRRLRLRPQRIGQSPPLVDLSVQFIFVIVVIGERRVDL